MAECEAACRFHLIIPIGAILVARKESRRSFAHSIKSRIRLAVRQVVFTDVQ
jgi:hypothetical protein